MRHIALGVLLLVYISNQWSRFSIVYLGGVSTAACSSAQEGDVCYLDGGMGESPLCDSFQCHSEGCMQCQACYGNNSRGYHNIRYGTCLSSSNFGYLLSFGYMLFFCFMSLAAGRMADKYNRNVLIALGAFGWGSFTIIQGLSSNFTWLAISRAGVGLFGALSGPASLSLIAKMYPTEELARANSIYTFGIYLGGALSSFSITLSLSVGWRVASYIIGGVGILSSLLVFFFVKDPKTSQSEQEVTPLLTTVEADSTRKSLTSTLRHIARDKAVLCVFIAGPLRFLGGFAIGTYVPQYFSRRYPEWNGSYGTLNAFIVSLGGASSSFAGGYITDRWLVTNKSSPAYVPAISSILGIIPFLGVMYSNNFWVAILCLLIEYLAAESWFGPALSILQRVPEQSRGTAVAIYLFVAGLFASIAPALLGSLDDGISWHGLRRNLSLVVSASYFCTFVVFYICGRFHMKPQHNNNNGADFSSE
mmetsp:Transcript_17829/g.28874  ORF Transcript_17829/g.28874 Transcript_17829/m.28874 type:complete len:476 (-) Transcript_17829:141-1568(-)